MTQKNLTEIVIVLDASTSMAPDRHRTRSAVNEFIAGQKNTPGECRLSLITFHAPNRSFAPIRSIVPFADGVENGQWYTKVWDGLNIQEITELSASSYIPDGNTALYDACKKTIDETGARLRALPEYKRPEKVYIVIMTDGEENSSRSCTKQQLKDAISHQEGVYNWNFIFLGADFNAKTNTDDVGLDASRAYSFNKADMVKSYKGLSRAISEERTSGGVKLSACFAGSAATYAAEESN